MDGIPVDLTATGPERRSECTNDEEVMTSSPAIHKMLVPKDEPGSGNENTGTGKEESHTATSFRNSSNDEIHAAKNSSVAEREVILATTEPVTANVDLLDREVEAQSQVEASRPQDEDPVISTPVMNYDQRQANDPDVHSTYDQSVPGTRNPDGKEVQIREDNQQQSRAVASTPTESTQTTVKSEPTRTVSQAETVNGSVETPPFCSAHCSKVMCDILSQRQFGKFCDLVIKTGEHQIFAHKCVLSANSPYFDAFLLSGKTTMQGDGGHEEIQELHINEFQYEILEALINYMYTGNISLGVEAADQLIELADKFLMPELKQKCSQIFCSSINLRNWNLSHQIAEKYVLSELARSVSNFLIENVDDIVSDSVFLELNIKELVSLFERDMNKTSEPVELKSLKAFCHWISHDFAPRKDSLSECLQTINDEILNKTRTYNFIDSCFSGMKNNEILKHPSIISWLLTLPDDEDGDEENDFYESMAVSDESVGESDGELFVPGKEIPNVMPSRRTRSSTTPRRKRKSSNPQRFGFDVPPVVNPPVKRGRGRPRSTDPKKIAPPKAKRKVAPVRKKKLGRPPASKPIIDEEHLGNDDLEIKTGLATPKRGPKTVTERSITKCPECAETFTSQNAFRQHMKGHGEVKPFKCNLCSFQTVHYGIFTSHKRRQHRVDIQCPKCPREFPSQSALNHHMRGHGSDTPFLCDVCGFTTKHFASMNIHKRRHNGKKLKCPHEGCTYEAVRHTRLRDHMNMHLGLKNYICTVCGKAFGARKHLFRHENIHKTEKTLNCEQCAYTTSRRDKIRQHIKRHHPNTAVVLGYLTEHEAAVQIHKNLNNIKPTPGVGPKKSHKKKKKPKEEAEKTEVVLNSESLAREAAVAQLAPAVTHHVIAPVIQVAENQGELAKTEIKQTATVAPNAASTIVDMIHYFMAPDGANSEQHHTWSYHNNPL